jgi:flagellar hook-associated protein 1
MTSPFFGLNIGASALRTAQTLVDITNQNIANANTPGYSRQSATVTASTPYPVPVLSAGGTPGQLGTGVQITSVNRARDTFVDTQIRGQLTTQGQVDAHSAALAQVEAVVNEPSSTGLSSTLTQYWSAWQEVANTPADSSIRANLIQQGAAVADAFQGQVSQFKQQQSDLDKQVGLAVTSVNTLAGQIAAINTQISQVQNSGMQPNDLRDQRDVLVDSLSKLVKINAIETPDGQVSINVGNHTLIDRGSVNPMLANATAGAFTQVQWSAATYTTATGSPKVATPTTTTGGTLLINNVSVTLGNGLTPQQVVNAINGTAGLGATGAVIASLNSGGALVLTSTAPGSTGAVTVGAAAGVANTINADLGLPGATTQFGTDANTVNLGGGQLQGLIDSRDTLLQERIDGVNALASRVIQSVNSVSASGVGLDGVGGRNFFTGTDASSIAVDPQLTATGGTDKVAAGRLYADPASATGYSSAAGDSSNALAMAQLQNLTTQSVTSTTVIPGALTPGQLLGPSTVIGIDLSGAAANTTYTFTTTAGPPPTASVSDGTTTKPATITVGADSASPPNSIIGLDTGSVRLTLSAPNGTSLSTALAGLNGPPNSFVTTTSGPATIGDQYAQQISALGVESQSAQNQSTNQSVLVNQLQTQRASTSGVSLDEETINLITYQKAYQAAARIVTVMDEMLDTLINHTGIQV